MTTDSDFKCPPDDDNFCCKIQAKIDTYNELHCGIKYGRVSHYHSQIADFKAQQLQCCSLPNSKSNKDDLVTTSTTGTTSTTSTTGTTGTTSTTSTTGTTGTTGTYTCVV